MQQNTLGNTDQPVKAIITQAGLEKPQPQQARAWAGLNTFKRLMILWAARCPESNAYLPWEDINSNTRQCIQSTASLLVSAAGGLARAK